MLLSSLGQPPRPSPYGGFIPPGDPAFIASYGRGSVWSARARRRSTQPLPYGRGSVWSARARCESTQPLPYGRGSVWSARARRRSMQPLPSMKPGLSSAPVMMRWMGSTFYSGLRRPTKRHRGVPFGYSTMPILTDGLDAGGKATGADPREWSSCRRTHSHQPSTLAWQPRRQRPAASDKPAIRRKLTTARRCSPEGIEALLQRSGNMPVCVSCLSIRSIAVSCRFVQSIGVSCLSVRSIHLIEPVELPRRRCGRAVLRHPRRRVRGRRLVGPLVTQDGPGRHQQLVHHRHHRPLDRKSAV